MNIKIEVRENNSEDKVSSSVFGPENDIMVSPRREDSDDAQGNAEDKNLA